MRVLENLVTKDCCKDSTIPVIVSEPTGLAAYKIEGCTIPRILCLPVEHGKPANYSPLIQDQLVIVRATLKELKLLIIDEISMVTLLYIHLRLIEVMACDKLFGV